MMISPHFSLAEFARSQQAARLGIDNTPPDAAIANIKCLAELILEPIRAEFGPVTVTSGYRCPSLNRATPGSSAKSQHMLGQAADIVIQGRTAYEVAMWVSGSDLPYDQVIHEFGEWVHVSWSPDPRRSSLTAVRVPGRLGMGLRTVYVPGIATIEQARRIANG